MSQKGLGLSDGVIARIVNIIQEAMLLGCDCVDLLRMIRVCNDSQNPLQLVLTEEYEQQVGKMHAQWLENAEKLQSEQQEDESDVRTTTLIN